jgi:hypothetical protein
MLTRPKHGPLTKWESDMTWHMCYALGAIGTLCLFIYLAGFMSRGLSTKGEVVTTIVGLILTLPIVGILIATVLFWGIN